MKVTAESRHTFDPITIKIELLDHSDLHNLNEACGRILETAVGLQAQELARAILNALQVEHIGKAAR